MDSRYLEALKRKVAGCKVNYINMCQELSKEFGREAEYAKDNEFFCSTSSNSYILKLPVVRKEIEILEALIRDVEDMLNDNK
jgi:hypothetical protein